MIPIPEAELVDVRRLKLDGQNPNIMSEKQLARLKTSIEKFGFIVPIVTNKDLLVADGEQRLTVARHFGMKQVPVIRLPIEDVDRRLLRQVLNKLRGEHELIADALEFERIIEAGHEDELKHLLDLSDSQLERYLSEIRKPNSETYEILEIDKIKTDIKRGDIYVLRNHRLMCGDATSHGDVQALMNGKKADMVFTDPPYGLGGYAGRSGKLNPVAGDNDWVGNIRQCFLNIPKLRHVYVCCDWRSYPLVMETLGQPKAVIVWTKNHFGMGRGYRHQHEFIVFYGKYDGFDDSDVWDIAKDTQHIHPTQKPINLALRAIQNSCPQKGGVLDLFGGSGSTLIACEQTGRTCYIMEIDPRYCQVIINRWESCTGQKAEKIKDD